MDTPVDRHAFADPASLRALGLYAVGFVLIAVLSIMTASGAFMIYIWLPGSVQRASWIGFPLNSIAPFVGGCVASLFLGGALIRRGYFRSTVVSHAIRALPWYAYVAWVLYMIQANASDIDFGLWSQGITWPLWGVYGALVVDVLLSFGVLQREAVLMNKFMRKVF